MELKIVDRASFINMFVLQYESVSCCLKSHCLLQYYSIVYVKSKVSYIPISIPIIVYGVRLFVKRTTLFNIISDIGCYHFTRFRFVALHLLVSEIANMYCLRLFIVLYKNYIVDRIVYMLVSSEPSVHQVSVISPCFVALDLLDSERAPEVVYHWFSRTTLFTKLFTC